MLQYPDVDGGDGYNPGGGGGGAVGGVRGQPLPVAVNIPALAPEDKSTTEPDGPSPRALRGDKLRQRLARELFTKQPPPRTSGLKL